MAVVTVAVVAAVVRTGEGAADSTAAGATPGVASTAAAMVEADIMADRPTADIAAERMAEAAATQEAQRLDGPGRLSAEACGILRPDSIRLPDPGAEACPQVAVERWVRLAEPVWPRRMSPAALTGIFTPSVGPIQRTHRSTTLAL